MAERIDEFCENLRVRLTSIDNEMQSLKSKIDQKVKTAGQDVQTQLNAVKKRIEQDRAKLTAAQNDMQKWMEERKSATREKVAEWRARLEKAKLQSYADSAERYAAAAAVIDWPRWTRPRKQRWRRGWRAGRPTAHKARKPPERSAVLRPPGCHRPKFYEAAGSPRDNGDAIAKWRRSHRLATRMMRHRLGERSRAAAH